MRTAKTNSKGMSVQVKGSDHSDVWSSIPKRSHKINQITVHQLINKESPFGILF